MKILFFIESLSSGGKERRLVELIQSLRNYYPEIEYELVLTKKNIHYKGIFDTDITIHYIERKYLKKDPRLFFKFYKIAKTVNPDIIHVWGNMVAIYAIPAKVLLNIPLINNQITDAPIIVKGGLLSYKLTFLFSDLIIANSKAGIKSYNAPVNKSKVIYNGFNFDRIKYLVDSVEIRKQHNIQTNFVIGMVASFSYKKDYTTYIRSAISILKQRNDVTFLCIGSGNDTFFRELIPEEFRKYIKFLGKQDDVESIMNICDIGVLSTYTEGISNSLMEFMALGKPVIATNGGGTNELIVDNETGYLVSHNSPSIFTEKICQLLNNKELRVNCGDLEKKIIESKFGMMRMCHKFMIIYNKFGTSR